MSEVIPGLPDEFVKHTRSREGSVNSLLYDIDTNSTKCKFKINEIRDMKPHKFTPYTEKYHMDNNPNVPIQKIYNVSDFNLTLSSEFREFITKYYNKTNATKHEFSSREGSSPLTIFTVPHRNIFDILLRKDLEYQYADKIVKVNENKSTLDISNDMYFKNMVCTYFVKNKIAYSADILEFSRMKNDYLNVLEISTSNSVLPDEVFC